MEHLFCTFRNTWVLLLCLDMYTSLRRLHSFRDLFESKIKQEQFWKHIKHCKHHFDISFLQNFQSLSYLRSLEEVHLCGIVLFNLWISIDYQYFQKKTIHLCSPYHDNDGLNHNVKAMVNSIS